jgi:hypothetical protein
VQIAALAPAAPPSENRFAGIISDFPEIFAEFRRRRFKILWRAAAMVSKHKNFTADATSTQTLGL